MTSRHRRLHKSTTVREWLKMQYYNRMMGDSKCCCRYKTAQWFNFVRFYYQICIYLEMSKNSKLYKTIRPEWYNNMSYQICTK